MPYVKTLTLDQINKINTYQQYQSLDEYYAYINAEINSYNEYFESERDNIDSYNYYVDKQKQLPYDLSTDDKMIWVKINTITDILSLPLQTPESLGLTRIQPNINIDYVLNNVFSFMKTLSLNQIDADQNYTPLDELYDSIYMLLTVTINNTAYIKKIDIDKNISDYNQKNPSNPVPPNLSIEDQIIFILIQVLTPLFVLSPVSSPVSSPMSLLSSPMSLLSSPVSSPMSLLSSPMSLQVFGPKPKPKPKPKSKSKSKNVLIIVGILLLVIMVFMMKKKKGGSPVEKSIAKFGKFW
jgi:hypothetical protein